MRILAATTTAQSASNACAAIAPFYWEYGDRDQGLANGSVDKAGSASVTADSSMEIASASKWIYGAYVAERRAGALTAEDIQYLNFRSGYTNFPVNGCAGTDTVAACEAAGDNGVQNLAHVGKFYYGGGHMQKHASLASPGMNLGAKGNAALMAEVNGALGTTFAYSRPQLAGGVFTSAKGYAVFLRKLLGNQLKMSALLGSNPVCTNPATCADALYTPVPGHDFHYSLGHWVEDDPVSGDGAFSSPGAFGFYPWVDADKAHYGVIARFEVQAGGGEGFSSAQCGQLIRKAWATGTAQ